MKFKSIYFTGSLVKYMVPSLIGIWKIFCIKHYQNRRAILVKIDKSFR